MIYLYIVTNNKLVQVVKNLRLLEKEFRVHLCLLSVINFGWKRRTH